VITLGKILRFLLDQFGYKMHTDRHIEVKDEVQLVGCIDGDGGVHQLVNAQGYLQIDIGQQSITPLSVAETGTVTTAPPAGGASIQEWAANASSAALGSAGELYFVVSAVYLEAGAATPAIALILDSSTEAYTGTTTATASARTELTNTGFIIDGDATIDVVNGAAGDSVTITYMRLF
jgi:hypothetical protein